MQSSIDCRRCRPVQHHTHIDTHACQKADAQLPFLRYPSPTHRRKHTTATRANVPTHPSAKVAIGTQAQTSCHTRCHISLVAGGRRLVRVSEVLHGHQHARNSSRQQSEGRGAIEAPHLGTYSAPSHRLDLLQKAWRASLAATCAELLRH